MNAPLFTHIMNRDLLVNLYDDFLKNKSDDAFDLRRILSPDVYHLESFIQTYFSLGWDSEIKAGCFKVNPTVFIAIKDGQIVGFAGYDCTAKGYFGPTGVHPKFQGQGIGRALLLKTLLALSGLTVMTTQEI